MAPRCNIPCKALSKFYSVYVAKNIKKKLEFFPVFTQTDRVIWEPSVTYAETAAAASGGGGTVGMVIKRDFFQFS